MARNYFKKLWSTILSNGVRLDPDGNWTIINSSTNKRRMQGKGSGVGGPPGEKQKIWVPAKIILTPQEIEEKWNSQNGMCYWFEFPLDLGLLYKDHLDWMPKHPLAPSIDRINIDEDYTKDNVVICCRGANLGRNICEFNRFHEIVNLWKNKKPV
jgi:hypothetical protein